MKKLFKILGIAVLAILLLIFIAVLYINNTFPKVDAPAELTIEATPELIARGEYLANHVAVCMDCHSTRDFSKFAGPPTPGTYGKGGDRFDQSMDMPGVFYAKNITPFGIDRYSDGELFRAITAGVTKEGDALFPLMPYPYYGQMDDRDIHAIIAYLRSLPAIENEVPAAEPDFPFSIILKTIPTNAQPQKRPEPTDQIAYGKYMATFSGCVECHSPVKSGQIIPEMAFSGGREFPMPGFMLRTPNITPHKTGLGDWTEDMFIAKFKSYENTEQPVAMGEFNTLMPWTMYAGMDTTDLKAIFAYLKTVEPIENTVIRYEPTSE